MAKFYQNGQTIMELLIAIALAAILLPAIATGLVASREGTIQQNQQQQAEQLLIEAKEATRSVREKGWANVATNGTYHPVVSGTSWSLVSGPDTTNGLTRQIVISNVYRDNNGVIVSPASGTLDPSSKTVTTTISWATPHTSSLQSTWYLTRYLDNLAFTHTTTTDFTAGLLTNTQVAATTGTGIPNDGEVILGAGGQGDWCKPNLSINALDLPGQGITTAIMAIPGHAYTTTGGNSSGDSMDQVIISDPPSPNPPIPSLAGQYINWKTYGIFGDNSYAYLVTDHPGVTLDIIQISSLPYTSVGTFNSGRGGAGDTVFVTGNVGYVTTGNVLHTIDLSSKTGSRPELGNITLSNSASRVYVVGNYAYVTLNSNDFQMEIIDISNPKSLMLVSNVSLTAGFGRDVYINSSGTRAYLATSYGSTFNEFFILDVTNKSAPVVLGSYNSQGMDPKGVVVVTGNRALLVGSGAEQYQVINISTETAPARCGGLTNPNGASAINGVSTVIESDGDAFSYILTNNSSKEFQIIAGGNGAQFSAAGTFESSIFDAGYSTAYNRFSATVNQPVNTTIQLQVAVAPPVSGSCTNATFSYVGPNGVSSAYFVPSGSVITGAVPFGTYGSYQNPNRCFRYKLNLNTSDPTQTPIIFDNTVNYSP